MRYADVIVDISHEKLDKPFQYIIPEYMYEEIDTGSVVEIPFGKGNRLISGYVIGITEEPKYDIHKMKSINNIMKGHLKVESQMIALAGFIKKYYGCTMNKALKTVIPVKKAVKGKEKKYVSLKISREEASEEYEKYAGRKNTVSRAMLIKKILQDGETDYDNIINNNIASEAVIKGLEKQRIIEIRHNKTYRNPVNITNASKYNIILNDEQNKVVDEISSYMLKKYRPDKSVHLLFGITGSGKTEVYMELIKRTIESGREVIVLIPEIALTYQTINRFYSRFGDKVSFINSRLSQGEKYDQFEKAKNGEISIMVGPRSALFTPFRKLGLIIIDEEHESAYKSDSVPKYHARETAIKRAELAEAYVVLGSATPSVTSFYRASKGEYILHKLMVRAGNAHLPKVNVVDLREELEKGNREIFSIKLQELIKDRLDKKEQTILFINRRGYSGFVSCRACGKPVKCPHCDVSLTYHKNYLNGDKLVCHYCGYSIPMPKSCPKCNSKYIGRFGIGTEQVEERVKEIFPHASVLRMDMDTTREKGKHEEIIKNFSERKADILIGTQMIVKGHDFPYVTLVGVIAADLSLFSADYMAGERTFELLTQAAGRAGRGNSEGEVVIQTYNPEEQCILFAAEQNYEAFYESEIGYRALMQYPPAYTMMVIMVTDKNENKVISAVNDFARRIENSKVNGLNMIGPSVASVSRINDIYRYVIYLKHADEMEVIKVKDRIMKYIDMTPAYFNLNIQFDFNPMNGY